MFSKCEGAKNLYGVFWTEFTPEASKRTELKLSSKNLNLLLLLNWFIDSF
jgi:hypothetical protein